MRTQDAGPMRKSPRPVAQKGLIAIVKMNARASTPRLSILGVVYRGSQGGPANQIPRTLRRWTYSGAHNAPGGNVIVNF